MIVDILCSLPFPRKVQKCKCRCAFGNVVSKVSEDEDAVYRGGSSRRWHFAPLTQAYQSGAGALIVSVVVGLALWWIEKKTIKGTVDCVIRLAGKVVLM